MSALNNPTQTNASDGVAEPDATLSRNSSESCSLSTTSGPAPAVEPVPSAVGRYTIIGEIARGGMGVVYRATDPGLNREVAVKLIRTDFRQSPAAVHRFTDEAAITGQLQHPGIPPVHEVGTLPDGSPFLAMKLIRGRTLGKWLRDRPDPAADRGRLVAVFEQICQAVGYAHAHQVIHRDLKPANVMVGAFGEVQVMDWGLAKVLAGSPAPATGPVAEPECKTTPNAGTATRPGSVLGTPAFMPPEQAAGEVDRLDERADVFGLGAILCVILTGQPPYVADTAEATRLIAARGQLADCLARLDRCGADPELVTLCRRCLAPERDDRPRDADQVAKAVEAHLAEVEGRARQAEVARAEADARATGEANTRRVAEEKAAKERKLRKMQLGLAAAVGLLAVGGGAVGWWQNKQATERRAQEIRNADALSNLLVWCEQAMEKEDTDRSAAALAEADQWLREGGVSSLGRWADRCRADLAVLRELDAIDDYRWTPVDGRLAGRAGLAARWRAAFDGYGVSSEPSRLADAADRVSRSHIRNRLVYALDLWLEADPSPGVRAILREADPDPYRDAVRDAVAAADRDRVAQLAGELRAVDQPPWFVASLGQSSCVPADRRRVILGAALRASPNRLPLLMELGASYPLHQREGADDRARWFQAAVSARPGNTSARNGLGTALFDRGDLDGAIAEFREAIRLDSSHAVARMNLGVALDSKGDRDGAVTEYQAAIRIDPTFHLAHYNLGNALADKGDRAGAIGKYRKAIELDPTFAPAHYNLGLALAARSEWAAATVELREAAALDPKKAQVHYDLGITLHRQRDWDGAIAAFRRAIELDSKYGHAHNNLGAVLADKGDWVGAAAQYQKAIDIDPENALAHYNLGNALSKKEDLVGAIGEYRKAIELDPAFAPAHHNLGLALSDKGDRAGAIGEYQKAIGLDPNLAPAHFELGLALADKGDLDQAAAEFREATALGLTTPDLRAWASQVERWRELAPRLSATAAGRGGPASPADKCELASLAARPFHRQYYLAVRLFQQAFAADPKCPLINRYRAACAAAQAAIGRDIGLPVVGVDEWGYLTGLAHEWVRAPLAALTTMAGDRKYWATVRQMVAEWRQNPDLMAVRDPAWLAAMPAADRERWQALWADVDALLAKVSPPTKLGR